jgi:tRNA(Ile)-lysidine synthase
MSPSTAEGIIRPLLFVTRDAVLEYLQERGMEYRQDSTNFAPSCQRNFLRLKVFPLLREAFHPQIAQTIARCADLAREEESLWASQIRTLWGDICLELSEGLCALDFGPMKQLHPALARRMLRLAIDKVKGNLSGVGMVHLEALIELVSSGKTGKSIRIPGGIEATRHGAKLLISSKECAAPKDPLDDVLDVHGPGNYLFGKLGFEFRFCEETKTCCGPDSGAECIRMDSGKLKWPLQFRYRRTGDRFRPFGMTGSKKLQDFFTDCMVPREKRQKVPLLCDSEKICWVVGMRIDDRVKVEAHTRQILVVKLLRLPRNGEF